jgi:alpha-D-ribose 1-methylphosphonate 5-triphosphate synthase subunit PhnG
MMTDAPRRRWMSVLALAMPDEIEAAWRRVGDPPLYARLRGPEVGLMMVRARAGGTGLRFNVGETTVTRCAVQLVGGALGQAWVRGRDLRHAERAAVLDALLQDDDRRPALEAAVIEPLASAREARRRATTARAAATRVEFFTMVRGED